MESAVTSLPNSSSLLLLPPQALPLLQQGPSHGLFPPVPMWAGALSGNTRELWCHTLAGKYSLLYLLHCGLLQGLKWNLCSSAWSNTSTSCFPFNLCVPCAASHYVCLFLLYLCVFIFLIPLLEYVFPETSLSWLRGSAVSCSKSMELT